MGGSFSGGGLRYSASKYGGYHLLLIYGGLRYWTKTTKQFTGATIRRFRWISPWFVLPLATLLHRSTSLGRSVEGGYVFLFLVFWSFGFRVGFHAPLLVARMGGVSLSLHVHVYIRSLKQIL